MGQPTAPRGQGVSWMSKLMGIMSRINLALVRDRSGASAVEYGLLAAGISVAIIATVFLLGTEIDTLLNDILTKIKG